MNAFWSPVAISLRNGEGYFTRFTWRVRVRHNSSHGHSRHTQLLPLHIIPTHISRAENPRHGIVPPGWRERVHGASVDASVDDSGCGELSSEKQLYCDKIKGVVSDTTRPRQHACTPLTCLPDTSFFSPLELHAIKIIFIEECMKN